MSLLGLKSLGIVIEWNSFIVFFGGKSATLEKIQSYTAKGSSLLKQVHGTSLVPADLGNEVQIADAQWAYKNSPLPLIKTADCLPIMIADPLDHRSLCIHAGWKGVRDQIVPLSIESLRFTDLRKLKVWIGPHIQFSSFEVDREVGDDILKNMNRDEGLVFKKNAKFYINLSEVVTRQLIAIGIMRSQIWISDIDTKTSSDYYSYRRKDSGRNYSFCLPT